MRRKEYLRIIARHETAIPVPVFNEVLKTICGNVVYLPVCIFCDYKNACSDEFGTIYLLYHLSATAESKFRFTQQRDDLVSICDPVILQFSDGVVVQERLVIIPDIFGNGPEKFGLCQNFPVRSLDGVITPLNPTAPSSVSTPAAAFHIFILREIRFYCIRHNFRDFADHHIELLFVDVLMERVSVVVTG